MVVGKCLYALNVVGRVHGSQEMSCVILRRKDERKGILDSRQPTSGIETRAYKHYVTCKITLVIRIGFMPLESAHTLLVSSTHILNINFVNAKPKQG